MVTVAPDSIHLSNAVSATQFLYLRDLPAHVCVGPMPPGALLATDLPLKDLDAQSFNIKHFIDLVVDVPKDSIDIPQLQAVFRDKAWDELPDVMKPKLRPQFQTETQYFLLPQDEDHLVLLKHVYILDDKVTGLTVQSLLRGSGKEILWGNQNKKLVRKAFQWMLEQLGGLQFRKYTLSAEKRKPASSATLPEDAGWQFIQQHGELDKSELKQLKWIHYHINLEGCPIHGWQERLVQKALDSLANDSTCAKLCSRYDLTISDFEPEVRNIMEKIVPSLRDHALWLLGEAGRGKTPLGRVVAMMFSRYHGGQGTFRTTADLDFFKGVPFTKTTPAIFDDGNISGEEVKKIKAFTDVADDESMTRARWTSAKFVRHQLREVLDNSYNPDAEPEDNNLDSDLVVSHEDFFLMIRPALGSMSRTDAMAILKRSAFVIFGKKHITYRLPSERETKVHRIRWQKFDIILDTSKPKLKNFKKAAPLLQIMMNIVPGKQCLSCKYMCALCMKPTTLLFSYSKELLLASVSALLSVHVHMNIHLPKCHTSAHPHLPKRHTSAHLTHALSVCAFDQVWLQEAIRKADHLHAEKVSEEARKSRELKMHSIPFVKMEQEEYLGLSFL